MEHYGIPCDLMELDVDCVDSVGPDALLKTTQTKQHKLTLKRVPDTNTKHHKLKLKQGLGTETKQHKPKKQIRTTK